MLVNPSPVQSPVKIKNNKSTKILEYIYGIFQNNKGEIKTKGNKPLDYHHLLCALYYNDDFNLD